MAGKVIIFSAPSGAGKSTVLKQLLAMRDDIRFSVSATTRNPREGEQHGREYYFLTREEFQKLIDNDELLEYAQYVENYYGTPIEPIKRAVEEGINILLDIEVQGAKQVLEKLPEAISVFLAPPSFEELERRLRTRGTDSDEVIAGRLERALIEFRQIPNYKYLVINDDPKRAAGDISAILAAESCSSSQRKAEMAEFLSSK